MRKLLVVLVALTAFRIGAADLRVEPRSVRANELVTATLTLEGEFATSDAIDMPLHNLELLGEPSVSSEFSWVNGDARRRKTLRYRLRPLAVGSSRVGPIVIETRDGQRETLPAVEIEVTPDRVSTSNEPAVVLRELTAAGRDPLFLIVETDKRDVFAGEPVVVTWWLYNAAVVQDWQVVSVPKLPAFWSEERPRSERAERVFADGAMMQRLAVRRAVLVPLQSGRQTIDGMTIEAAVMRRREGGPFAMYEGELAEVAYTSAPVVLNVKPIPAGPPVDAVGSLRLSCSPPVQKNDGPVVLEVTLGGEGNLRAARPPRFAAPPPGELRIEGGETVTSAGEPFTMTRRWRYLIFPASDGLLEIPPLSMTIFDTALGTRSERRCASSFVQATSMAAPVTSSEAPPAPGSRRFAWRWIVAAALLGVAMLLALPRLRRELAVRREARAIVRDATPQEVRSRIESRVHVDVKEMSDRGDAMRALISLLAAFEHDRDVAMDAERELERRVRDVLRLDDPTT